MLLPFIEEGLRVGAPTILVVDAELDAAIGRMLGDESASAIRLSPTAYRHPLAALQREWSFHRKLLARGAREVRMVATLPPPGTGADWPGWVRFEAAVNHFFAELPVSRTCAYDLRTTPDAVIDDVIATHPRLLADGGSAEPNPAYVAPEALLPSQAMRDVDPIEATAPTVELLDPSADQARAAVEDVARDVPLRKQDVNALCVAADEAVTNARRHGYGTVRTRIWRGPNRVAVAVSDEGDGPASPFAGMLVSAGRQGMWLLHQLCTRVSTTKDNDGFTVHMVAQANVPRRG